MLLYSFINQYVIKWYGDVKNQTKIFQNPLGVNLSKLFKNFETMLNIEIIPVLNGTIIPSISQFKYNFIIPISHSDGPQGKR